MAGAGSSSVGSTSSARSKNRDLRATVYGRYGGGDNPPLQGAARNRCDRRECFRPGQYGHDSGKGAARGSGHCSCATLPADATWETGDQLSFARRRLNHLHDGGALFALCVVNLPGGDFSQLLSGSSGRIRTYCPSVNRLKFGAPKNARVEVGRRRRTTYFTYSPYKTPNFRPTYRPSDFWAEGWSHRDSYPSNAFPPGTVIISTPKDITKSGRTQSPSSREIIRQRSTK